MHPSEVLGCPNVEHNAVSCKDIDHVDIVNYDQDDVHSSG